MRENNSNEIDGFGVAKQSERNEKKNLPIKYNEPCKTDYCYTNIGQRCSDCLFNKKGKFEGKK